MVHLFVAGAIFGDVGVAFFVAVGTTCGENLGDSRSASCLKVSSANGRVRDDEFMVGCSDMFGSCSNRPRSVNDASCDLCVTKHSVNFRGRCNIW